MVTSLTCTSSHKPRILVIEDDDANRLLFSDYLIYVGFTVLALPDGLDLEQHLKEFQPDLLLLDLGLPEVDGYGLLETLQHHPQWQSLPVVVVSGYAFTDNQNRALALGARKYLVKPVRLQDLIGTIHSVLAATDPKFHGLAPAVEPELPTFLPRSHQPTTESASLLPLPDPPDAKGKDSSAI